MIRQATFHNFKGLRDVSLDLERLTVIVGPNASGKSSLLEGLVSITRKRIENFDQIYNRFATDPLTLGTLGHSTEWGDWSLSLTAEPFHLHLSRRSNHPENVPDNYSTHCTFNGFAGDIRLGDGLSGVPTGHPLAKCIPQTRLLRFDSALLSNPSHSDSNRPLVDDSGNGLASHLAFVKLNDPDKFSRIEESLQAIVPIVTRIRFDRFPDVLDEESSVEINGEMLFRRSKRNVQKDRILFDMLGARSIPAGLASEGTILVLGLITILLGNSRPQLLLLDDIDKALHPRAQRELVRLLREILGKFPDLQIVATSHSPYLLDELRPEEVRLTALKEDGSVVCGRLDQHPDFDRWKDEMSPGEFWSLVGESWLAEPKTAEAAR